MATTKLGSAKSASRAINYAEKRAEMKSGHNLDINYAKSQMKATRSLYGKDDGIQAHTIIQSFKPEETTSEQANQIGRELAEKVASNHQAAVYTHTDTDHIHNHIVVNSINLESGKKYQSNAKQRHSVKDWNDSICQQHGLSVVKEKNASVRHTLAEQELLKKEKSSWKETIRQSIEKAKEETTDWDSFKSRLETQYGVETKMRGNTLSFKHQSQERFVRANKLGADYGKEAIENGFRRKAQAIDWNDYERTNRAQEENLRNRPSKRAYSTTYRPISRKYRGEQQQRQREYEERLAAEQRKREENKRKNQRAKERSGGLSL